MFRDRNVEFGVLGTFGKELLLADLELPRILKAMSAGDETIYSACETALFQPLTDIARIKYRQDILADARRSPEVVRALYSVVVDATTSQNHSFRAFSTTASSSLYRSALDFLSDFINGLFALRQIADKSGKGFTSEGLRNLFDLFQREMDDAYFKKVREKLRELQDAGDETYFSAKLGHYLQGVNYVFRKTDRHAKRAWRTAASYTIPDKEEQTGQRDFSSRSDRALNEVANTLAAAAKSLDSFYTLLRNELAFYIGCLNLEDALAAENKPVCMPELLPMPGFERYGRQLYDVSLVLTKKTTVVAGDFDSHGRPLMIITGANQGGKSTFLRSIGQAQIMAQAGMIVGGEVCRFPIRSGLFTHFKREEDSRMKSGKLDEELTRLARALEFIKPGAVVMFNESFASTNEREGSEILRQITRAFREIGVEIFSVTHLYAYSESYMSNPETLYLRAQRLESGERTFLIEEGLPQVTAYGEDLYNEIFGEKA
jgi:DNA mismatch repair ATPase MutS